MIVASKSYSAFVISDSSRPDTEGTVILGILGAIIVTGLKFEHYIK